LVGLTPKVIKTLPSGIIGIQRTENINELVNLYSAANVYFNPTWEDNFPTTNIEAMSCGTPVVVYNTGGCAETINKSTGIVIDKGNLVEAKKHIMEICSNDFGELSEACRKNVVDNYKEETCYNNYLRLYNSLVK
jgi:glycosyltransferase involved in cell wall biosynthesis